MNNILLKLITIYYLIKITDTKSIKRISFPFKREIQTAITNENLFEYINNSNIQITIEISKEHFKIPLNIKLRQYPIFFTSPESYLNKITYNYNQSSSFKSNLQKLSFKSYDFFSGIIGNDTIYINDKKIFQFNFFIGYTLKDNIKESGSIGFNFDDPEKYYSINFIHQLHERNLISSYEFTLQFNDNDNGELIIGGKPHEYDSKYYNIKNYYQIPFFNNSTINYDILLDSIYYGNVNVTGKNQIIGKLEIESGVIIGSNLYQNEVKNDFFNKFINEKKCFEHIIEGRFFYYYSCDKSVDISILKPLTFYIQNINFTFQLDYKDLFYLYKNNYYFLVSFKTIENNTKWVLGKPLFIKYQFVFDQKNKIIGFYSKFNKHKKSINWKVITYCIIILGFILLIFILLKFCVFRNRKTIPTIDEIENSMQYLKLNDNDSNQNILKI